MPSRRLQLVLYGPARLEAGGGRVKLQRKSLALLYVLAIDGPTRRERLADLLWDQTSALRNLRVELHLLRRALSPYGVRGFDEGDDPLRLPAGIAVDRRPSPGGTLEGLEDLSCSFGAWLDEVRARLGHVEQGEPAFADLVTELAATVRVPYLLVVEGLPMSGRRELAVQLAQRMELPFDDAAALHGRALHYLPDVARHTHELVDRILTDRQALWVVARTAFGEDPDLLLALRARYPAERMRYLRLTGLDWRSARRDHLRDLPFEEAAKVYMASGGLLNYVRSLMDLRSSEGFPGRLPVPQRVRAAFQLELRRVGEDARYALEQISVVPTDLPESLLERFGVAAHLPELERRRWVTYDGRWSFASDVVRRLLYEGLRPGQRMRLHLEVADHLEGAGRPEEAAYHLREAHRDSSPTPPLVEPRAIAQEGPAGSIDVAVGAARRLDPDSLHGNAESVGPEVWWPQTPEEPAPWRMSIVLPPGRGIVRVRAHLHVTETDRFGARPVLRLGPRSGTEVAAFATLREDGSWVSDATLTTIPGGGLELVVLVETGGDWNLEMVAPRSLGRLLVEHAPVLDDGAASVDSVRLVDGRTRELVGTS